MNSRKLLAALGLFVLSIVILAIYAFALYFLLYVFGLALKTGTGYAFLFGALIIFVSGLAALSLNKIFYGWMIQEIKLLKEEK
jgi:hypothetical protein